MNKIKLIEFSSTAIKEFGVQIQEIEEIYEFTGGFYLSVEGVGYWPFIFGFTEYMDSEIKKHYYVERIFVKILNFSLQNYHEIISRRDDFEKCLEYEDGCLCEGGNQCLNHGGNEWKATINNGILSISHWIKGEEYSNDVNIKLDISSCISKEDVEVVIKNSIIKLEKEIKK